MSEEKKKIPIRSPHYLRGSITPPWRDFYQYLLDHIKTAAYAELYQTTHSGITITTAGTYVQWTDTVKGLEKDDTVLAASATTDDITAVIGQVYTVNYSGTFEGEPGIALYGAVFINDTISEKSIREIIFSQRETVYVDSITEETGKTITGTTNTREVDQTYCVVDEATGTPGFDIRLTFCDPEREASILRFTGRYEGNPAHNVKLRVYNNSTSTFDDVTADTQDFHDSSSDYSLVFTIGGTLDDYYDVNDCLEFAIVHTSSGASGQYMYIDFLSLEAEDSHGTISYTAPYDLADGDTVDFRVTTNSPTTIVTETMNLNVIATLGGKGDRGITGLKGDTGATGASGAAGEGVPTGGSGGSFLYKTDGTDYNTEWVNDTPNTNDVPKWNGTDWIFVPEGTDLAFSVASYTDNISGTKLIGSGVYIAAGGITFNVTYNNGPPTVANITNTGSSTNWSSSLDLTTPFSTIVSAEDTYYPSSRTGTITFTLNTTPTDSDIETISFSNTMRYGNSSITTQTEASIEALTEVSGPNESRDQTISNIPTTANYLVFAYADALSDVAQVQIDDGDGFVTASFNATQTTVAPTVQTGITNVTNSNSFDETFASITSTLTGLANGTRDFKLLTSSTPQNYLYFGALSSTTINEAQIEALSNEYVSNDHTRTWAEITAGASDYLWFCWPARLGTASFYVGGFEGGFESPTTVSVTNIGGFTEDYYCYRSTNDNLGATTVTTA